MTETATTAAQEARAGKFKILVSVDDSGNFVTIEFLEGKPSGAGQIQLTPVDKIPFLCLMVATEHLMRLTAQESTGGFDKALELLVQGARVNQDLNSPGRMTY